MRIYIYIHIFSGNQKAMENHLEMEVLMGKSTLNHPLYIYIFRLPSGNLTQLWKPWPIYRSFSATFNILIFHSYVKRPSRAT